jgi:hypothetical protein
MDSAYRLKFQNMRLTPYIGDHQTIAQHLGERAYILANFIGRCNSRSDEFALKVSDAGFLGKSRSKVSMKWS